MKLTNREKHDFAAVAIKYLRTIYPELKPKEMRNIFITAYHDLTKQMVPDEKVN